MTVTTIAVTDMHCAACISKVRKALRDVANVSAIDFNPVRRQVFITHNNQLSNTDLLEGIESAGFAPQLISDSVVTTPDDAHMMKRLGVAGISMMQVMMVQFALYAGVFQGMDEGVRRLLEYTALLFCTPVVAYCAMPFFTGALASIRRGLNMDTPIGLAIAIAFAVSLTNTMRGTGEVYYDSVVMFTFLMLGARVWEQKLRHRLSMDDSLQASLASHTTRIEAGTHHKVEVTDLQIGDVVWIAQGEQIPADGELLDSAATIEQAWLTGESDWRSASAGAQLYAGTFNQGSGFRLLVSAPARNSRAAQIDALANTALGEKHKYAQLADRVAQIFIPSILCVAAITYLAWQSVAPERAIAAALAVLVVSCPCALSLATPAALTAALTRLRRAGILVKHSAALERVSEISRVWFDKTGTLTRPKLSVVKSTSLNGFESDQCFRFACALQCHSAHPLASAFNSADPALATDVEIRTGYGITGQVNNYTVRIGSASFCGMSQEMCNAADDTAISNHTKTVFLAINGQPAAVYQLSNELRPDAAQTISALGEQGLRVQMLSGDTDDNCAAIAKALNIDYIADASPEDKPLALAAQQNSDATLFIGDGVNDLPALANASVSVATVETADLVKSKADVQLLSSRLGGLLDLIQVGRATRTIMRENLAWAAAYNLIAIPLAALGFIPPWGAALGMSLSSLLVMLNSTRLLALRTGDAA